MMRACVGAISARRAGWSRACRVPISSPRSRAGSRLLVNASAQVDACPVALAVDGMPRARHTARFSVSTTDRIAYARFLEILCAFRDMFVASRIVVNESLQGHQSVDSGSRGIHTHRFLTRALDPPKSLLINMTDSHTSAQSAPFRVEHPLGSTRRTVRSGACATRGTIRSAEGEGNINERPRHRDELSITRWVYTVTECAS